MQQTHAGGLPALECRRRRAWLRLRCPAEPRPRRGPLQRNAGSHQRRHAGEGHRGAEEGCAGGGPPGEVGRTHAPAARPSRILAFISAARRFQAISGILARWAGCSVFAGIAQFLRRIAGNGTGAVIRQRATRPGRRPHAMPVPPDLGVSSPLPLLPSMYRRNLMRALAMWDRTVALEQFICWATSSAGSLPHRAAAGPSAPVG